MTESGKHSLHEIGTQQASWQSAIEQTLARQSELEQLFVRNAGNDLVFTGCGSTHYLAQFAAPYFQSVTGRRCRAVPSSELLLQTDTVATPDERPLIVALSRSGATSETIMAVEKMRARGSDALTISCYADTPLAAASSLTVDIPEGREESFAQTRSFAGMLVAVQCLAALVAGDARLLGELRQLPSLGPDLIQRAQQATQPWATTDSYQRITYLGSGPLYGLANEATVKMKEMALSLAEGYHFMEFRHGPMSLVDHDHLVVGLVSESTQAYELAVLQDLRERHAHVLVVANRDDLEIGGWDDVFFLNSPLSERASSVLYLPFVQYLACQRACWRGLNPDRPRNVVMSIQLRGTNMV
jgi:glucosamine--fructose-6-phosphate aminotransferase (isomerizing)